MPIDAKQCIQDPHLWHPNVLGSSVVSSVGGPDYCAPSLYDLPGIWPDCIIAAFCSWNRCPNRSAPFRYLSTHRETQFSSFECKDFVVKSLTQSSKHLWTSLEYICRFTRISKKFVSKARTESSLLWGVVECRHTFIISFICFFSILPCSSRCSDAFSLVNWTCQLHYPGSVCCVEILWSSPVHFEWLLYRSCQCEINDQAPELVSGAGFRIWRTAER